MADDKAEVEVEKTVVQKVLNGADATKALLIQLAQTAESAERYEDMRQFMKACVELVKKNKKDDAKSGEMLEAIERNLLSVAYKNVVGGLRSSWRAGTGGDENEEFKKQYNKLIENELEIVIGEILGLLETLAEDAKGAKNETEVFYLKMTGDYHRYMAEFSDGDKGEMHKAKTEEFYEEAMEVAKNLPETHPTRLGLALNFSVCYYEILKKKKEACDLAKSAFDGAIQQLDTLNDSSYKDSTLIMQLLRDNLTLWNSSGPPEQEQPEN